MEIDPSVIKRTQDVLGKIIKKPPLTEKLLSRPPFRFLHDICTAVIKGTGLCDGLFTAEELVADNVKEKQAKLVFLQKLIDFLSNIHGTSLDVKPGSIIAGKEPEKTNKMLVALAEAVSKKNENRKFVAMTLTGKNQPKASASDTQKARTKHSQESRKPRLSSSDVKEKRKEVTGASPSRENNNAQRKHQQDVMDEVPPQESADVTVQQRVARPSSAKGNRRRKEVIPHPSDKSPSPSARKPSISDQHRREMIAVDAAAKDEEQPPKTKQTRRDSVRSFGSKADASEAGAVTASTPVHKIISELDSQSDDNEDDQYVIEEYQHMVNRTGPTNEGEAQQHSDVVNRLLQSKKDQKIAHHQNGSRIGTSVVQEIDEAERKRERALNEKEVAKVCENLQSMGKNILPFAKMIEFIQEDLDTMQLEYDKWSKEKIIFDEKIAQETKTIDGTLEPLRAKLKDAIHKRDHCQNSVQAMRAKVIENHARVQEMLEKTCEKI